MSEKTDVDEGNGEEGSRMNGKSRIREDEGDDEEGGCRRRGGWKKGMSRKSLLEKGDVENWGMVKGTSKRGRMNGTSREGQGEGDIEEGVRVKGISKEGAGRRGYRRRGQGEGDPEEGGRVKGTCRQGKGQ